MLHVHIYNGTWKQTINKNKCHNIDGVRERTESPLLVLVNASYSCTTTSAAMVIITAYTVRMQAANKCISTSAATEVRCSDVEMRGVGTAPTLTAAAAPAPVLSPRMVGPWLRGPCPVHPHPRVSSVRYVSSEQRGPLGGRGGDGELWTLYLYYC